MLQSIAKEAPNGLFTATVSPDKLMRYKSDGTFSSIVRAPGKGGIRSHEGFQQISLDAVKAGLNPAAVIGGAMQVMAMVSGQYYMHQLSTQLKSIGKQLDRLKEIHDNEKIGALRSVRKTIADLTSKENPDANDLIRIQAAADKAQDVFHEYLTCLDKIDVEEIAGSKKGGTYRSETEINALCKRLDDSEIIFTMQVCFQASLLVEKCKAAEIAIRMRLHGYDARTAEDLRALVDGMGATFHGGGKELCKEYLQPVLRQSREYAQNGIKVLDGIENALLKMRKAAVKNQQPGILESLGIASLFDPLFPRKQPTDSLEQIERDEESWIRDRQQRDGKLVKPLEQYLERIDEAFQAQSKDSQAMITGIDEFLRTPRTLLYLPGNPGEERVFVVEESDASRAP